MEQTVHLEPDNKPSQGKKGAPKLARSSTLKKVDLETAKILQQFKDKVNRKSFGRKVRDAEILSLAIRQLNPEHIKALQEQTYSEKDRLRMAHEDYQKSHGRISLDQFIGKLLRCEISQAVESSQPKTKNHGA